MQHHVYFWLKQEHQNAQDRDLLELALDQLTKTSHIAAAGWGKPAATKKRPVIEDSYSYCLYLTFETVQDHDLYQAHPGHIEFHTNYKGWWDKVVIMDSE